MSIDRHVSEAELSLRLSSALKDFPGFPRAGIVFKDICPVLANPPLFEDVVMALSKLATDTKAQAIVGIESRGFIFGTPTAMKTGLPFIPARKKGKLPGELLRAEYALEYGTDIIEMQRSAIVPGQAHLILDDVLATGGTAKAVAECVTRGGGKVCGFGFVINIGALGGTSLLKKISHETPILSLLTV